MNIESSRLIKSFNCIAHIRRTVPLLLNPVLWFFIGLSCTATAQDQWINYTNNHSITDMVETDQGYWLASTGGLCFYEFDSEKATYFNRGNSNIPSNTVYDLYMDSDDVLWMTTSHGLCTYENGQFTTGLKINGGILNETIDNKIILATSNNLYIQNQGMQFDTIAYPYYVAGIGGLEVNQVSGVIYFNGINYFGETYVAEWNNDSWTYLFFEFIYESSITLDQNNQLWFLTSAGLSYLQDTTWIPIPDTIHDNGFVPSQLHVNKDNEIIIELRADCPILKKWDGNSLTDISFSKDECKDCFFIKPSSVMSDVYYATNRKNGFYSLSAEETNDYQPLSQSPLIYNQLLNTAHPSDGSHIIVYFDKIQKLQSGNWSEIPVPDNISGNILSGQLAPNDVLWIHDIEQLWYYQDNDWHLVNVPNQISDDIKLMEVGANGEVWIQSGTNIARYANNSWEIFRTSHHGISNSSIKDLKVDPKNGDLWVTSFDGVRKFDGQVWTRYDLEPSNFAFDIGISPAGTYVIANGKLHFINNNSIDTIAFPAPSIFGQYISKMHYDDAENKLYLSGNNELAVYQNDEWTRYSTTHTGIYNGYSNDISIDQNKNIWLAGSVGGLGVFNQNGVIISSVYDEYKNHELAINVFPTVVADHHFFIQNKYDGNYQIVLSDLMGRTISTQSVYIENNQKLQVDIPADVYGLFLVTVRNQSNAATKRLIKMN